MDVEKPYVEWDEPTGSAVDGIFNLNCRMTIADAIALQKQNAARSNMHYDSDEKALDDFVVVHFAKVVR